MNQTIAGKVVVITGASSGLGEATARHLAALGACVVLGARRMDLLTTIAEEITAAGGQAAIALTDVTQAGDLTRLVETALAVFGKVDVLINNAGLMAIAPIDALKVEEWERMIDINIKGVLYGIAAALPYFRAQNSGHFINISSVAGAKVFSPGGTVYSGTKFAVRAISEGLRHELAASGGTIRTTTILPGAIDTELTGGSSDEESVAGLKEFYKQAIPADAVARAVAYAIEQPDSVDINEIVLRPTAQEF
jgi:NADP-dependent 3-hydroxy acid dehydrogenase YdfG